MNINLLPFTVTWVILAVIVLGLILYRKMIALTEDDKLHISDSEAGLVAQQIFVAHRLEVIDRWGQLLTVIAFVYGIAVASGYLYQAWVTASAATWR